MLKIGVFGDVHMSEYGPASRKRYLNCLIEKFFQIEEFDKQFKPDVWVCPGDWFHSKTRATHYEVSTLIDCLTSVTERTGEPVLTIVGNHDLDGDNRQSINKQPVSVLAASGVVKFVDMKTGDPNYIEKDGESYAFVGIPWDRNLTDSADLRTRISTACLSEIAVAKSNDINLGGIIVICHCDVRPFKTKDFSLQIPNLPSTANIQGRNFKTPASGNSINGVPIMLINGHLHDQQKFVSGDRLSGLWTGSLMRTSRKDDIEPTIYMARISASNTPCMKCAKTILESLPMDKAFSSKVDSTEEITHNGGLDDFANALLVNDDENNEDLSVTVDRVSKQFDFDDDAVSTAKLLLESVEIVG